MKLIGKRRLIRISKHAPKHIYDKTYMINYYVSYGVPFKKFADSFKSITKQEIREEDLRNHTVGKCFMIINQMGTIIWIWTNKKNIPELAHEVLHAVIFTFEGRIVLNEHTDEAYCYQMQMLMKEILQ